MAKNMALLESGVVTNLLWCSDGEPETENLIDCGERPISLGDTFVDGLFYRNGEIVLSENEKLRAQNLELLSAVASVVEDIYNQDLAEIGV